MQPNAQAVAHDRLARADVVVDFGRRIDDLEILVGELAKAIDLAGSDIAAIRDVINPKIVKPWLSNRIGARV